MRFESENEVATPAGGVRESDPLEFYPIANGQSNPPLLLACPAKMEEYSDAAVELGNLALGTRRIFAVAPLLGGMALGGKLLDS